MPAPSSPATARDAHPATAEFDRQIAIYLERGYPRLANLTASQFRAACERLRAKVDLRARHTPDFVAGKIPFVLVPQLALTRPEQAMRRLRREGRSGIVSLAPTTAAEFLPLPRLRIPASPVYLLLAISRGDDFRNVRPEDALSTIGARRRSPLTIAEGIAVTTVFPQFLVRNHCYSLSGSRRGDQRVPALWLSDNHPKLGWCWDRNPHTWLGSASCRRRIA